MPVIASGLGTEDVLGMAIRDDTLLVNLSEKTKFAIRDAHANEMITGYSLITTLCRAANLRRIRFWFAGDL